MLRMIVSDIRGEYSVSNLQFSSICAPSVQLYFLLLISTPIRKSVLSYPMPYLINGQSPNNEANSRRNSSWAFSFPTFESKNVLKLIGV
jgi:hypothetical protein